MSSARQNTLTATENPDCVLHDPAWFAQKWRSLRKWSFLFIPKEMLTVRTKLGSAA